MTAAANLRATNYEIELADEFRVRQTAGRIVPAMATTTAMITGNVLIELYKIVQGFDDIESYRNGMCYTIRIGINTNTCEYYEE